MLQEGKQKPGQGKRCLQGLKAGRWQKEFGIQSLESFMQEDGE